MQSEEVEVLCPRCKVPMNFYSRSERTTKQSSTEIKVVRYFKCPVCGKTVVDEELLIKLGPEGAVVTSHHNGLANVAIVISKPIPRVS